MSDDPLRVLLQGAVDPNDTRFQFEIIKGMSDSIRQLAGSMADMQRTQVSMLERLAKLEAGKVTTRLDVLDVRVDDLFKDKDRRDGALGMLGVLRVWGPVVFSLLCAFWLYGRSAGVVPAPPTQQRLEATIQRDERRIEGTVQGAGNVH